MNQKNSAPLTKDRTRQPERQVVVFDLGGERYGVDISSVREIIRPQAVTKVPRMPGFVQGLINLRGQVIPVVDLRKRFDLEAAEETKETRIVVVAVAESKIGVIVDAVEHVIRISEDAIEPPSAAIVRSESDFILGIAKLENGMVIMLNLAKVLAGAGEGAAEPVATTR